MVHQNLPNKHNQGFSRVPCPGRQAEGKVGGARRSESANGGGRISVFLERFLDACLFLAKIETGRGCLFVSHSVHSRRPTRSDARKMQGSRMPVGATIPTGSAFDRLPAQYSTLIPHCHTPIQTLDPIHSLPATLDSTPNPLKNQMNRKT